MDETEKPTPLIDVRHFDQKPGFFVIHTEEGDDETWYDLDEESVRHLRKLMTRWLRTGKIR